MSTIYRWHGDHALIKCESSQDAVTLLNKQKRGTIEGWTRKTGWIEMAKHDGEAIVWNNEAIEKFLEGKSQWP